MLEMNRLQVRAAMPARSTRRPARTWVAAGTCWLRSVIRRAETPALASLLSLVASWIRLSRPTSLPTLVYIGAVMDVTLLPGEWASALLERRALIGTHAISGSLGSSS